MTLTIFVGLASVARAEIDLEGNPQNLLTGSGACKSVDWDGRFGNHKNVKAIIEHSDWSGTIESFNSGSRVSRSSYGNKPKALLRKINQNFSGDNLSVADYMDGDKLANVIKFTIKHNPTAFCGGEAGKKFLGMDKLAKMIVSQYFALSDKDGNLLVSCEDNCSQMQKDANTVFNTNGDSSVELPICSKMYVQKANNKKIRNIVKNIIIPNSFQEDGDKWKKLAKKDKKKFGAAVKSIHTGDVETPSNTSRRSFSWRNPLTYFNPAINFFSGLGNGSGISNSSVEEMFADSSEEVGMTAKIDNSLSHLSSVEINSEDANNFCKNGDASESNFYSALVTNAISGERLNEDTTGNPDIAAAAVIQSEVSIGSLAGVVGPDGQVLSDAGN